MATGETRYLPTGGEASRKVHCWHNLEVHHLTSRSAQRNLKLDLIFVQIVAASFRFIFGIEKPYKCHRIKNYTKYENSLIKHKLIDGRIHLSFTKPPPSKSNCRHLWRKSSSRPRLTFKSFDRKALFVAKIEAQNSFPKFIKVTSPVMTKLFGDSGDGRRDKLATLVTDLPHSGGEPWPRVQHHLGLLDRQALHLGDQLHGAAANDCNWHRSDKTL